MEEKSPIKPQFVCMYCFVHRVKAKTVYMVLRKMNYCYRDSWKFSLVTKFSTRSNLRNHPLALKFLNLLIRWVLPEKFSSQLKMI